VQFGWFSDGLFVTASAPQYRSLLGCRLQRVGTMEVEAACQRVAEVISHDNEAWVKSEMPRRLLLPRLLAALGVTPSPEEVEFGLVTPQGERVSVRVASVPPGEVGPMRSVLDEKKDHLPVYLSRGREPYWSEYLPPQSIVYVQYNQCADARNRPPVSAFVVEVETLVAEHGTARLVIDLRNNSGGNSALLDPLIEKLAAMPRFQTKGSLFVIIGRATFSSGMLNAIDLRDKAKAVMVGEPSGGKPNSYGEVKRFGLPNSALTVLYSTKLFRPTQIDTPSMRPDIETEMSYADYAAGRDPAMEAVGTYPAGGP
jgi:hypothetical protein